MFFKVLLLHDNFRVVKMISQPDLSPLCFIFHEGEISTNQGMAKPLNHKNTFLVSDSFEIKTKRYLNAAVANSLKIFGLQYEL